MPIAHVIAYDITCYKSVKCCIRLILLEAWGLEAQSSDTVDQLLAERGVQDVAASFDTGVRASWPLAEVGFVTSPGGGKLVAPGAGSREQVSQFLSENQEFIAGNRQVELFAWNAGDPGYAYGGVDAQIVAATGIDAYQDELTVARMPMTASSLIVALCTMAPWPRVTRFPIRVMSSGRACTMTPSSTAVPAPISMAP